MSTSTSFSSGPPLPTQDEKLSASIVQVLEAYHAGTRLSKMKNGGGSMVLVRAKGGQPVHTRLYDPDEQKKVVTLWSSLKSKIQTTKQDAGNLYFHLHGVLFLMVPHVSEDNVGEVEISLQCNNDPLNHLIEKRTLSLASGPQAVLMFPTFTIPFTLDQIFFYYSVRVVGTFARVPCSVLAFWRQSVERKTVVYRKEVTQTWMLEKLAMPRFLNSIDQAKALLASAYGTSEQLTHGQQASYDLLTEQESLRLQSEVQEREVHTTKGSISTLSDTSLRSQSMRIHSTLNKMEDPASFSFFPFKPTGSSDAPKMAQMDATIANNLQESVLSSGSIAIAQGEDFGAMATHSRLTVEQNALACTSEMFDFTTLSTSQEPVLLELEQPAIVSSQKPFLVARKVFDWKESHPACAQLTSLTLPWHLNTEDSQFALGTTMLSYFDAALIQFTAQVSTATTAGANGQIVMYWDEGDFLDPASSHINHATLFATNGLFISAYSLSDIHEKQSTKVLTFTPQGLGEYLPLDKGHEGSEIGSLRINVVHPLKVDSTVQKFQCTLTVYAKVLATNIMQPQRAFAQFQEGVGQDAARFASLPVNQLILSKVWTTSMPVGDGFTVTFSPTSVFKQHQNMQPSLVSCIAANCRWWTGDCVFEIAFDKTMFHGGAIVIAFGSLDSVVHRYQEMFALTHTVCNLSKGSLFQCRVSFQSWNGKNFLAAGRRESLPRPDHKTRQRIFFSVAEVLQSSKAGLQQVGVTVTLKSIENCWLGGGVPLKPLIGHAQKGSSGRDFFFSELDRIVDKPVAKPKYVPPRLAQSTIREKFSYFCNQYVWEPREDARVLVLPCAPWSHKFSEGEGIVEVITNPLIAMCSCFTYWRGSLQYNLTFFRDGEPSSTTVQVMFENTGFPKDPGFYKGVKPLTAGGGTNWHFTMGPNQTSFSFSVEDDQYLKRRHTRRRNLADAVSRISTISDRLGNLVLYLPPSTEYTSAQLSVKPGPDFNFSVTHPPTATNENISGKIEGSVYALTPGPNGYVEIV